MSEGVWRPTGQIRKSLDLKSKLAKQYVDFLSEIDPVNRWEDLKPLDDPIKLEKEYTYNIKDVTHWSSVCPQIVGVADAQDQFDSVAPLLGFRYAWSRAQMHCKLLNALDQWYGEADAPTTIIEPGCFCSGLIHFLPTIMNLTYFGVDISPIALDVCRKLEEDNLLAGTRKLMRADFQVMTDLHFHPRMQGSFQDTLLIFCNLLGNLQSSWKHFAFVDASVLTAWLVSHWVNLGATVVVCERNIDPAAHRKYILQNGRWEHEPHGDLLDDFQAIATTNICVDNPLGDWEKVRTGINVFTRQ